MFHTRQLASTLIALCGFVLTAVCAAHCDIIRCEPVADSFIMSSDDGATYNFGTAPFLFGYKDEFQNASILLKFDVAKIQPAKIRSARLCLWSTGWVGDFENTAATSVFALSSPWRENEVNWYNSADGIGWKCPGGDLTSDGVHPILFATNTQGLFIPSESTGMMEWDITELVRLWASRRLANNGLRLDTSNGIFLFESREGLNKNVRPSIILDIAK